MVLSEFKLVAGRGAVGWVREYQKLFRAAADPPVVLQDRRGVAENIVSDDRARHVATNASLKIDC